MGYSLNHGVLYLEEIYTAVVNCESIRDSAMILLMLSSNMNSDLLSVLRVGDFLDACSDYLDDKNDIDELFKLNPWSIVPCWRDVANQKILLFNTPEATFHILLYLNKRRCSGEKLTHESPLFIGKNKSPLEPKSIRNRFSESKLNNFHVDFSQTSLLKTFRFYCKNYCENEDLVKLLLMEDIETNPLYLKSNSEVKEYYKSLVPYLTVISFDCQNKINSNINRDIIVDEYYTEYIEHRNIKYEYMAELKIKKMAIEVKDKYFNNSLHLSSKELDAIYKYAECYYLYREKPYSDESYFDEELNIDWFNNSEKYDIESIFHYFKDIGVIEVLEISEEKTKKEIMRQAVKSDMSRRLSGIDIFKILNGFLNAILIEEKFIFL